MPEGQGAEGGLYSRKKSVWMMPAGIKALAVCEPRLWP